ncbi:MAG: hypothetical protein ACE5HQ_00640 [Gemmatimonadota bacterium]
MSATARGAIRGRTALLLTLGAACYGPGMLGAQEIRFSPDRKSPTQLRLAEFLSGSSYRLWTRDTVLTRSDRVSGDVLVLEGSVRIAGRVDGSIYVVDGDLFLRPGARIAGDIVILGGGYYTSGLARVEGDVAYRPNEIMRVLPERGGYRILSVRPSMPVLELGPMYGLRYPSYQRADGWTVRTRGRFRPRGVPGHPEFVLGGRLKTDRGDVEGTFRNLWHPDERLEFEVWVDRATRSNDRWIRSDFSNTNSFLFFGDDYRDYYRADRAGLGAAFITHTGWRASLRARWEYARSLRGRDRTVLFSDDSVRPNPPIDPGDTYSLLLGLEFEQTKGNSRTLLHFLMEGATADVVGDFSFLLGEAQVELRRPVVAGQAIELFARARGDLSGHLPRQRYSALGGVGTLPTFDILSLRGERMAFGEATYLVSLPFLDFPQVGPTELFLRAAIGSAWSEGEGARFEQNLSVGARVLFFEAGVAGDPGVGDGDLTVFVKTRFPKRPRGS